MKHSIVLVFVSLTTYVVMASAQQQPTTWTNPYFFYHYNNPLTLPTPQKISADQVTGNQKVFSGHDDYSIANTLGSHVVMLSTCLRELKTTKSDLVHTTQRLEETRTVVESVKGQFDNVMAKIENLTKVVNERTSPIVDIGKMPTSCADLQRIGNKKNGFFSIMGQNKIKTVHCNFTNQQTDQNFQNLIGYVDVKSSPVYFYAQRTADYNIVNKVIPFDIFKLNVGNAINSTGIFLAPKSGTYFFSFSTLSNFNVIGRVDLQMKTATADWIRVAQAFGQPTFETLMLQSTLQLTKGDQIRLILSEGAIHEMSNHSLIGPYMHFVGWLIEEDIF